MLGFVKNAGVKGPADSNWGGRPNGQTVAEFKGKDGMEDDEGKKKKGKERKRKRGPKKKKSGRGAAGPLEVVDEENNNKALNPEAADFMPSGI